MGEDTDTDLQIPVNDVRFVVVKFGDCFTHITKDAQDLLLLKDPSPVHRQAGGLFFQLVVHLRQKGSPAEVHEDQDLINLLSGRNDHRVHDRHAVLVPRHQILITDKRSTRLGSESEFHRPSST